MNGLHLGLFSVVCVTLLARSTTSAPDEDSVEHDIVCEGSVMILKCLNNSFAITIQSAIYGRNLPGNVLCPKLQHMSSSLSDELTCTQDVYSKVNKLCEGKVSCDIPANKSTFQEPCPNVYKYLDVAYKCEDVLTRGYRQLEVLNFSQTPTASFLTNTKSATRMSVSSVQLQPTLTLVHKIEQLNTVYNQLSNSSTFSPTSQPDTTSSSHSVSVSRVSQGEFTRTAITKVRSTSPLISSTPLISLTPLMVSSPPSKPAPKTSEKITTHQTHASKEKHGTMKLFHFILSFQIVRQEKLEKDIANSLVCFFLGLLLGLLIMMAIFVFYRLRHSRRKRLGKPNKAAYSKHEILNGDVDEKVELNSKESEALEMESQFGETV